MRVEDIDWAWVEITRDDHGHGGPGWEFGTCLWSPTRNKAGRDRYAIMREPKEGEAVIHFLRSHWDDGVRQTRLCGISLVKHRFQERKDEPPSPGEWAGMPAYYRIELSHFTKLDPGLPLEVLTQDYKGELLAELEEDEPRFFPFNPYRDTVRTVQGIYLARGTPRLLRLIKAALGVEAAAPKGATIIEVRSLRQEFSEGMRKRRESYFFVRNHKLVMAAKRSRPLKCEACGFDFRAAYGPLGEGFIECHHLNPLSERAENTWPDKLTTSLDEVVLLCSNCHRMIHRHSQALSLDELRAALQNDGST